MASSAGTWRFFFSSIRRHTRCLSDWSSDVCSSDLRRGGTPESGTGLNPRPSSYPSHSVGRLPRPFASQSCRSFSSASKFPCRRSRFHLLPLSFSASSLSLACRYCFGLRCYSSLHVSPGVASVVLPLRFARHPERFLADALPTLKQKGRKQAPPAFLFNCT